MLLLLTILKIASKERAGQLEGFDEEPDYRSHGDCRLPGAYPLTLISKSNKNLML